MVNQLGNKIKATTEEASSFGEVVLVAIPFGKYQTLRPDLLAGKIVIDAMNYYQQRDGELDLMGLSSSELVARHLPDSQVVKAFNTMYFKTHATEGSQEYHLRTA
jgi:predicted dinucleotide-binding enzyme